MSELVLKEIDKVYKIRKKESVHALDHVSLSLDNGLYGLTGENGAGKSTLIRILAGITEPDSGEFFLDGRPVIPQSSEYKEKIGYMPQQQWIYENMSCMQFINYMAGLKGIMKADRKAECEKGLEEVGLTDRRHMKIGRLSGGMKQRLLFAQALLGEPQILILDEPTAGVDPDEREKICALAESMAKDCIVMFATHILSDLQGRTKDIIRLEKGKLAGIQEKSGII